MGFSGIQPFPLKTINKNKSINTGLLQAVAGGTPINIFKFTGRIKLYRISYYNVNNAGTPFIPGSSGGMTLITGVSDSGSVANNTQLQSSNFDLSFSINGHIIRNNAAGSSYFVNNPNNTNAVVVSPAGNNGLLDWLDISSSTNAGINSFISLFGTPASPTPASGIYDIVLEYDIMPGEAATIVAV